MTMVVLKTRDVVMLVVLAASMAGSAFSQGPMGPDWVPRLLAAEEAAEGFFPLFNGKDFDGWWIRGQNKNAFQVQDGKLVVTGEGGGDWIFTDRPYENFVLRFEYRCLSGIGNSGVAIRAAKDGPPSYTGMEIQVIKAGWENPWQRSGALYATVPPAVQADKPMGEWNAVEILCDGPRIRTLMNGQQLYDTKTTDYTLEAVKGNEWQKPLTDRAVSGHLALQDYANHVEFRNIRIKPLPGGEGWRSLFNGKDLTGWIPIGNATWEVLEGGILRVNGAGMTQRSELRTMDTFDNFELRLWVRPHTRPAGGGANSGIFFRGSGFKPWPCTYEAQVDNHDPKQFTGAVWDQVPASELRARDDCWCLMHIVADEANIRIAVNGKTVVDYVSPKHNKCRSGWISLQGHDPESVVDFKDIEIKPITAKEKP